MAQTSEYSSSQTALSKSSSAVLLSIGFALHCTWVCSVMYAVNTPFDESFAIVGIQGSAIAPLYIVSAVTLSIVSLIIGAFDQRLVRFSRSRACSLIAACITAAGSFAILVPMETFTATAALDIFSGIATGVGSAILAIFWGIALSRETVPTIAVAGSVGVSLGYVLNTTVIQSIPAPFGLALASCIPFAEFLLLWKIAPPPIKNLKSTYLPFYGLPAGRAKFAVSLFLPIALMGAALGVLKALSVQKTLGNSINSETFLTLLMASSLSVALYAIFAVIKRDDLWDLFLRIIVPGVAAASLLCSLCVLGNEAFSNLFLLISYVLIESLSWIIYARIAHVCRLSPIFLFGLSRAILTIFILVGVLAPVLSASTLATSQLDETIIVIVALLFIGLSAVLMPRESDLIQTIAPCPAVRIMSIEREEKLGLLDAVQLGQVSIGGTANERLTGGTVEYGAASLASNQVPAQTEMQPQVSKQHSEALDQSPKQQSETPAEPAVSEARAAMLNTEEPKRPGKFSSKVNKVADTFLLTDRETEILFELAKGNSPSYIQSKFYISAGTVKTHIRNIYRKLDVHKRDELLRLIEGIDDQ